jgi:hypothetical protein
VRVADLLRVHGVIRPDKTQRGSAEGEPC